MTSAGASAGWPFLVAPGRVRDHAVLVAPQDLLAAGEYGVLETVEGSTEPSSRTVLLPGGRPLTVWCRARALTARDVAAVPGQGPDAGVVRDEHNRPLWAVVGVAVRDPSAVVSDDDLDVAWERVLPAYRMFLQDEAGFAVQPSAAMPVTGLAPAVERPAQRRAPYAAPPTPARPAGSPARQARVLGPAVAVVVAVLLVLHPWSRPSAVTPRPTATTTSTSTTTPTSTRTPSTPTTRTDRDGAAGRATGPGTLRAGPRR